MSLGQRACLLCSERRGEGEDVLRTERRKKHKEMKIVAAVQITPAKGFDFSNTALS